jgi:hypothetical protein
MGFRQTFLLTLFMKYTLILIAALLLNSGCATENWYKGMQSREQARCLGAPESEYEDCMKYTRESYDDYRERREQVDQ